VLGASAPPVSDSPPDAAAQRGAASHSLSSSDEGFGDAERPSLTLHRFPLLHVLLIAELGFPY
jgi:hypothetical protein